MCSLPNTPLRTGRGHELADSGMHSGDSGRSSSPRLNTRDLDELVVLAVVGLSYPHDSLSSCRIVFIGLLILVIFVVLTDSVAIHHRLTNWHVDNHVVRAGFMEFLARSHFGHVHVLATESQSWSWQGFFAQLVTTVVPQLDGVVTGHQLLCSDPVSLFPL